MADWSDLPQELLRLIAQRLDTCFDVVRFRSVCSSWRSSIPVSCHKPLRCPLPPDEYGVGDYCYLSRSCVYLLRSPPRGDNNLQDSPRGCWLFKIRERRDGALVLGNPFSSRLWCFRCNRLYRGLLLDLLNCQIVGLECYHVAWYADAFPEMEHSMTVPVAFMRLGTGNDGSFAVLGVFAFGKLAMFRSVDKQWKEIENTLRVEAIASFNGKFYVVDCTGTTMVINPAREVSYFWNSRPSAGNRRLVQSGGELFLVEVFSNINELEDWIELDIEELTRWVEVFKLDEDKNEWRKVPDLGGRVFFISKNVSFSCLASQIPGVSGSSIFLFNGLCAFDDVLVFNLKDRSCRSMKNIHDYLEAEAVLATSQSASFFRFLE